MPVISSRHIGYGGVEDRGEDTSPAAYQEEGRGKEDGMRWQCVRVVKDQSVPYREEEVAGDEE